MKRRYGFVLLVVLLISFTLPAGAVTVIGNYALDTTHFINKTNITTPTADLTTVVYGNNIYVFGGYLTASTNLSNLTYEYNTLTDTWTQKANMPTARWGMVAALVNDSAYVFAGSTGGGSTKLEVYNITNNSWTTKNNTPSAIANQGIIGVAYGNNIYLFYNYASYIYFPSNDTYFRLTDHPVGKTWATAGVVNNKIYIIGGYNTSLGGQTASVHEYDPALNTWTVKTSAPRTLYGTIRENPVYNNKIYHVYGQAWTFFSSVYVYDPANDAWKGTEVGYYIRDGIAGGFVGSNLYIIGGRDVGPSPYGVGWNEMYRANITSYWNGNVTYNGSIVDNFSQNLIITGTQNNTNIANGKTVFSDVQFSGTYAASKAVDGNTGTSWITPDSPTYPTNWTIDLGANYTLYNITAYQPHTGLDSYRSNEYSIWISYDNATYTQYIPKSVTTSDITTGKIFTITDIFSARYVRVQTMSKLGLWGSGISEFYAYRLNIATQAMPLVLTQTASAGKVINRTRIVYAGRDSINNASIYARQNGTSAWGLVQANATSNTWYSIANQYNSMDFGMMLQGNGSDTPFLASLEWDEAVLSCCYNLSGYVSNELGLYLQNTRLDVNGSHTFTDANGHYNFSGLSDSSYTVLARAIGYRNGTNTSTISQDTVMNFTLGERVSGTVSTPGFSGLSLFVVIFALVLLRGRS